MRVKLLIMVLMSILVTGAYDTACAKTRNLKIAMILWRGETDAELGFKEEVRKLGYDATYEVFNAGQDKSRLGDILRQDLDLKRFDYVYTFGTTVSVQTKSFLKGRVPQIFNIVSYPVRSGLAESMISSGGNICGVKSDVPIGQQIAYAMKILNFKRLGFIFNSREKNSNITLDELKALSDTFGFEIVKFRSPPAKHRLERNLSIIAKKADVIDAVFVPSDSYITSKGKLVAKGLNMAGIPTIGASQKLVEDGILLGSVADYYLLGQQAATILDRHQKGAPLSMIPIESPHPKLVINQATMKLLNLDHFIQDNLLQAVSK